MGIDGLQAYAYQQWPNTREIPEYRPNEEIQNNDLRKTPDTLPPMEKNTANTVPAADQKPDTRSRIADLEDISLTFHKEDTFDYIGSESGLDRLDVQKAISDMKKDEILQGYQYFVGSAQNLLLQSNEDGAVFRKLGF